MPDPRRPTTSTGGLLEYVSSPGCSDCRSFEVLVSRVAPDYPAIEVRAVPADSPRGIAISLGRGILRFPVIVLDDELLAIESIAESDLRVALEQYGVSER